MSFGLTQVWRGALLLADFILSEKDTFSGATVLELGAGTGLTSIVMATTAKTVYCTGMRPLGRAAQKWWEKSLCLAKSLIECVNLFAF